MARQRILVVDDEPDILEQIQELLEPKYEVVTATSFHEAVVAFDKQRPDVAVLDIMGVNGEDLLRRFQAHVPCIMLTAHVLTPQALKRTARAGAKLYLPKDELVRIPDYVAEVLQRPGEPLWGWLLTRIDFRRWFDVAWTKSDDDWLSGLTTEDLEDDLKNRETRA